MLQEMNAANHDEPQEEVRDIKSFKLGVLDRSPTNEYAAMN